MSPQELHQLKTYHVIFATNLFFNIGYEDASPFRLLSHIAFHLQNDKYCSSPPFLQEGFIKCVSFVDEVFTSCVQFEVAFVGDEDLSVNCKFDTIDSIIIDSQVS